MPSQIQKLYDLLSDGKPHRTDEIMEKIYGNDHLGLARISARILDIKNKHGVEIKGWHDPNTPSLYWYQILVPPVMIADPELVQKYPDLFIPKKIVEVSLQYKLL